MTGIGYEVQANGFEGTFGPGEEKAENREVLGVTDRANSHFSEYVAHSGHFAIRHHVQRRVQRCHENTKE